jgi:hypothetical protein
MRLSREPVGHSPQTARGPLSRTAGGSQDCESIPGLRAAISNQTRSTRHPPHLPVRMQWPLGPSSLGMALGGVSGLHIIPAQCVGDLRAPGFVCLCLVLCCAWPRVCEQLPQFRHVLAHWRNTGQGPGRRNCHWPLTTDRGGNKLPMRGLAATRTWDHTALRMRSHDRCSARPGATSVSK